MKTIKCEVIKDLLPLYVDDVLSKESRDLVNEHFTTCAECKAYCENLKGADVTTVNKDAADIKKVLQNIRKNINKKRIMAIGLTTILLVAISVGLYYCWFVKQSYLSYQESGLYVEDGTLYTKEPYYSYYAFGSPEEGALFVYMTTTAYESNNEQDKVVIVDELYREDIYTYDESETEEFVRTEFKRVYYISQENFQTLKDIYWGSGETEADYIAGNQERLEELKRESILIWEEK